MQTDISILDYLRRHFPQIAEKELQEEIIQVGKIMRFQADQVIMDYGNFIRLVPLVIEGSIKILREDESGNEVFLYYLEKVKRVPCHLPVV